MIHCLLDDYDGDNDEEMWMAMMMKMILCKDGAVPNSI